MDADITLEANLQETTQDILELVRPSSLPSLNSLLMLAAAVTTFSCVALLTVPGLIFNHPEQNSYFLFAQTLRTDAASMLPITVSGLCSASALLLPVPRFGKRVLFGSQA